MKFSFASFAQGWKTYLAVAGLLGLALYQASQGDLPSAGASVLAALTTAGLRHVVEVQPKSGAAALLLGLLLFPAGVQAQSLCDCTVRVSVPGRGGSAVLIARNGSTYLLSTAAHVVVGHKQATVIFHDNRVAHATVHYCNDGHVDLALMSFSTRESLPCSCLGQDPQPGDPIWQVGYPADPQLERQVLYPTEGHSRGVSDGRLYNDLIIRSGDSGGGFFDRQGRLVGVSCAIINGTVSVGPSASTIRQACNGIGVGGWAGICGPGGCCPPGGGYGGRGGGLNKPPAQTLPPLPPQPPPQPPPGPPPAGTPDTSSLSAQLAQVQSSLAQVQQSLAQVQAQRAQPGPAGPPGPQGPQGPAGMSLDPTALQALEARIGALETKPQAPSSPAPVRVRVEPAK